MRIRFGTVALSLVALPACTGALAQHDTIQSIRPKAKKTSVRHSAAHPARPARPSRAARAAPAVHHPAATVAPRRPVAAKPTAAMAAAQTARQKPAPQDVTAGLIAWWRCEGTAVDVTGRHPGTIRGSVTGIPGAVGQGLLFDGAGSGIFVEDAPDLQLTHGMTLCAWVLVTGLPRADWCQIIFRGDNRDALDPYFLAIGPTCRVHFQMENEANNVGQIETDVPRGAFCHVAATFDPASGEMRLYVNGKLAVRSITAVRPLRDLDPLQRPGMGIGNTQDPDRYDEGFHGVLDEVRIYDRPLTAAEVETVYRRRQ